MAAVAMLGVALIFYFFGALHMKKSYRQSVDMISEVGNNISAAEKGRANQESEWQRWEQARRDMKDLDESYFYGPEDWAKEIRLDIQRLLDDSRLQHSQKKFEYVHFEREKINKVIVEFSVTGRYNTLKAFIHAVESFPKLLMIEKIDFLDIDPQRRGIKLRILLAAYYALS